MATYDYDLGVIGGGAAGLTITSGAAQMGAKTLLVEMRDKLGGDCLHYGCVPSKTLIKSARVYHQMQSAPFFGLPETTPDPIDFSKIAKRIRDVIESIQPHDSPERFCSLGAKVAFGRATFIDEHTINLDGKTITAAKWAIATGSRPGAPPIKGLEGVSYLTNETLFTMADLPSDMLILGGGPIAVEMAQALNRLGCHTTLVQRSKQILSAEDGDMAALVQQVLENEGVRVLTGMALQEVRETGGAKEAIAMDDAGKTHVLRASAMLVALGRHPNVDTLDLEKTGVTFSAKGIPVDAKMRTNMQHIYAIGDVTGAHQFTHAAGYEGGVALSNAIIRFPRKADYTWMPRAVYTDPELAVMGKTERQLQAAGTDYSVWTESFADNDRSRAEGYAIGKLKLLLDAKERILGVHICGPHAGDLLGEWTTFMAGSVKLRDLAGAVHPYPTLGEINKRVAGSVMAPKIFDGLLKKGVTTLFNYRGRACELGQDDPEQS